MWWWLLGGWIGASIVLALWNHRLRRRQAALPEDVEEFLFRFETVLRRRHPDVRYLGLMPGRFAAILRVRGQETPVDLAEVFARTRSFPNGFVATIERLVHDVETYGLDRLADHEFSEVVAWILPQVRSRAWLVEQGRFGDGGLVHRMLSEDLAVVYVIDQQDCMVFVCHAHLRRWHKSEANVFHLAVSNLRRLSAHPLWTSGSTGSLVVCTGDGYDAARVLLLDAPPEDLLVAIPDRDVLWLGLEGGQDLAHLEAGAAAVNRSASHPVSPTVYRMRGGKLEPVRA